MNNSAIALKRLLARSYRCEGDTYCIKLFPRSLYKCIDRRSKSFDDLILRIEKRFGEEVADEICWSYED